MVNVPSNYANQTVKDARDDLKGTGLKLGIVSGNAEPRAPEDNELELTIDKNAEGSQEGDAKHAGEWVGVILRPM